jgi:hypothetical protein
MKRLKNLPRRLAHLKVVLQPLAACLDKVGLLNIADVLNVVGDCHVVRELFALRL